MQFIDIEKKDGGAYLHRYDLHYIDRTGCPRTYEMVSRDRNIDSLEHLQQHRTDAVVMVLTDAKRERMALNHEFRMELGQRKRLSHLQAELPDAAIQFFAILLHLLTQSCLQLFRLRLIITFCK